MGHANAAVPQILRGTLTSVTCTSFIHSFNPTRFQPQVPQLCPVDRLSRQPTRCGRESATPHFALERAICPQRPGVVWLLSATMYISSLEVTSFACVCVLRTVFPCVCRTRSLVCAGLFNARRGTVASCFASVILSVSPWRSAVVCASLNQYPRA
jgi:hypothetical protein